MAAELARHLRDEWHDLERKLADPLAAAGQLRGAAALAVERLLDEFTTFRARLRARAVASDFDLGKVMSRPAVTCSVSDTLARAVTLMWERDVGLLPVLDYEGKLAGTLTDRDSAIRRLHPRTAPRRDPSGQRHGPGRSSPAPRRPLPDGRWT